MNRTVRTLASLGILLGSLSPALPLLAQTAAMSLESRDLAKEETKRQLVLKFYEDFFNGHKTIEAAEVVADGYIQHNPDVPDGKKPFVSFFTGFFKENPQSRARIVRSSVDGDLVYLHVHSTNGEGDRGQAVVDIFRVVDGKIVEHWDVIQNVPENAANKNTMF